jgi:hypothetical protein
MAQNKKQNRAVASSTGEMFHRTLVGGLSRRLLDPEVESPVPAGLSA